MGGSSAIYMTRRASVASRRFDRESTSVTRSCTRLSAQVAIKKRTLQHIPLSEGCKSWTFSNSAGYDY
jgi:hypothetical protein